jgi:4a-hydroxytetrahydrobiopterin dehydratase
MALLNENDIATRLQSLGEWQRNDDAISRSFKFKDFLGSVDFVNRLAPLAEGMGHHPDLSIAYNKVTVSLSTHSEGGLTEKDFELATALDSLT